jgi:hypothetical protein
VNELSSALEQVSLESLNLFCGKDFGPFQGLLVTMAANLSILNDNASYTLSLLSCDKIVPIYINSVYGAACTYTVTGVTWTWASFLVMGFMGMLMITFRAAYLPNEENFDSDSLSAYSFDKDYEEHEMTRPSSADSSPFKLDESRDDESVYIDGADYSVTFDENSLSPR